MRNFSQHPWGAAATLKEALLCYTPAMDCYSTYQALKDFAGPVSVITAAAVAAIITYRIGTAQKLIAQSQRDIALDHLKFNLLQKRYDIYQATKDLLEYLPFIPDIQHSDSTKIRNLSVKIDEARFYFSIQTCDFLHDVRAQCETFLTRLGQRDLINIDDSEQWSAMAEALAKDQAALRMIYASLPQVFEKSLAFKQLTTDN
jgi:hypothetical protein